MELTFSTFNPWWRFGRVPEALIGRHRNVLTTLKASIDLRQMTVVTGLRRVGKSTLLFQLVDQLIGEQQVNPHHVLYFSFDEAKFRIDEILAYFQTQILQQELYDVPKVYVFFDEIQKLKDWPDQVKIAYDLYPNLKITLSGSANIIMKIRSRESLAGRFFDYPVDPLDLPEFLEFKGTAIDPDREAVFKQTLVTEFRRYLKSGGFIEAMGFEDHQLTKYFRESILERVAYREIPELFAVAVPELSFRLLNILSQRPGLYLDYKNLANDLQVDHRTVMNYFDYLEYSLLVQKLYNYSPNLLTSEKKLKRAYLSNSAFTHGLVGEMQFPSIMEQYWINSLKAKFFFRSPQKDEVDLILVSNHHPIPIEIKVREKVTEQDAKPLFKFMRQFNAANGLIISLDTEAKYDRNGKTVVALPYWKYWSIQRWLENPSVNGFARNA